MHVHHALVGRTEELHQLRELAQRPGIIQVTGGPGVGKTRLLEAIQAELAQRSTDCIAVTCTPTLRTSGILVQLLRAYTPHYPAAGFSQASMASDLGRLLKARQRDVVFILDHHESLKDGDEIQQVLQELGVSLTLILARRTPLTDPGVATVRLAPYSKAQARSVLRHVMDLPAHVLDVLAAVAAKDGMTRALVALSGIREPMRKTELKAIVEAAHDRFNATALGELTDHHLFVLAALAQHDGPMRSRHLRDAYTKLANANREKARANVQFLKYVDQLKRGGFVDVKPLRGNGMPGGALAVRLLCSSELAWNAVQAVLGQRAS